MVRLYEIDPDGDVVLKHEPDDEPFATWTSQVSFNLPDLTEAVFEHQSWRSRAVRAATGNLEGDTEIFEALNDLPFAIHEEQSMPAPGEAVQLDFGTRAPRMQEIDNSGDLIEIRVSSKCLIQASEFFRDMFTGPWKEAQDSRDGAPIELYTEEFDTDALLIVLRIIHGKVNELQKWASVELLAKIAVVVDFYQCREAVRDWVRMCIGRLKPSELSSGLRDTMLRILIGWVFQEQKMFREATSKIMRNGPVPNMRLPIPQTLIGRIVKAQEQYVTTILEALHSLVNELCLGEHGCSPSCRFLFLGGLLTAVRNPKSWVQAARESGSIEVPWDEWQEMDRIEKRTAVALGKHPMPKPDAEVLPSDDGGYIRAPPRAPHELTLAKLRAFVHTLRDIGADHSCRKGGPGWATCEGNYVYQHLEPTIYAAEDMLSGLSIEDFLPGSIDPET